MRMNAANLITLAVVAVYLMLPVDLISDVIPVVGQLDDTIVAVAGLVSTMARLKS
ncbi:DUF1232 domain-containing protein [Olsenella sp. Marseille-P4559]|jgi:uncharacterized membrane protein YkvA (DUF1232 family)|uniref:DUF1232 domain-containing protein n=1 Tax=Olsenella sp. Marseille-P4559 TaxID=2364795 RepID=UPI001031E51E|nr:DUF1232 domain-containing protein [Olsenella sp. Marseille-P4559]